MTGSRELDGRRRQLVALWQALAAWDAVVRWADPRALPDDVVEALCEHEARRIRVLVEGEASGWTPDWRSRPPEASSGQGGPDFAVSRAVAELLPAAVDDNGDRTDEQGSSDPKPTHPIRVRCHHRPEWRASV